MVDSENSTGHEPDPQVAAAIDALLGTLGVNGNRDLIREIFTRAGQLAQGGLDRGELKIVAQTLKDFRRSFAAFAPHRERAKVSIFGSARSPAGSPIYELARKLSAALVAHGYMVITGAGPGIMQACNEGATAAHSFGVSIDLPFEAAANPVIDGDPKHVHFKYFFTRKLSFVKESDAIVLFPGGVGTMDEGFESLTLLQTGKCDPLPVILMDLPGSNYWPSWEKYLRENLLRKGLISAHDRNLFRTVTSIERAIQEIEQFYACYHSIRYVGDYCILRLKQPPSAGLLAVLNDRYRDLLASGDFEAMEAAHPAERKEPESIKRLPRIGFRFIQRSFGRLRRLIDDINLITCEEGLAAEVRPDRPQEGHLANYTQVGD